MEQLPPAAPEKTKAGRLPEKGKCQLCFCLCGIRSFSSKHFYRFESAPAKLHAYGQIRRVCRKNCTWTERSVWLENEQAVLTFGWEKSLHVAIESFFVNLMVPDSVLCLTKAGKGNLASCSQGTE